MKYYLSARGFTMYESVVFINTLFDIITETLSKGESVKLHGFGKFDIIKRKARIGRNPKTLEPATIGPSRSVSFKAGSPLKRKVNRYINPIDDDQD